MQRFVGLLFVSFFAFPLGLSVVGCGHTAPVQYCPGTTGDSGPTTGQVKTITLAPTLVSTGESLNYGQIGAPLSASAVDCDNNAVSVRSFTYATTDPTIADINPGNGEVCGGTWNRNTGGGVANYTICTPPAAPAAHTAFITASGNGAVSNAIEVYIHPTVTSVVLGPVSADCNVDPASACILNSCVPNSTGTIVSIPVGTASYDGTSCLSQSTSGQLSARVYAGTENISCQVGPVVFGLQGTTNVASINTQGLATANQPGSALITATVSNSSSALNAGFISTCPPASIVLSSVGTTPNATSISVAINTPQEFTTTVYDSNIDAAAGFPSGHPITGVALEFNSTLPVNFPTSSNSVTALYPGSATITAVCQPPACNASPFSQISYLGNGTPVTSNGITLTAPGTASDVLYMASTGSQFLASEDFVTGQLGAPVKLPYAPNTMVISQDGSTIYMGSSGGLMVFSTGAGSVTGAYQTIQGNVLAVAPNDSYAVVTDPTRQTVSLVTSTGTVFSTFNGVGTSAQWTPDSNTLYVTTATSTSSTGTGTGNNQLLTYSTFEGWESTPTDEEYTDVAVTVPNAGAFFSGTGLNAPTTDGRSDCPASSLDTTVTPYTTADTFSPLAAQVAAPTDRLVYTTNGGHLLGATAQVSPATLQDIVVALPTSTSSGAPVSTIAPCPPAPAVVAPGYFVTSFTSHPLTGISASPSTSTPLAITNVAAASNSNVAAVTYTGEGGVLPLYAPATGTVTDVTLSGGAATAPVAGVFSTDNNTFYAGTSGDNVVHVISITGATGKDTGVITPTLTPLGGGAGTAQPNLIVLRAIRTTS